MARTLFIVNDAPYAPRIAMEHGVPEWRAQGWRVDPGDDRHAAGRP